MKFSEWTKRADSHVIDNAAGDNYEVLPQTSKDCIDSAIERFIEFRKSHDSGSFSKKDMENFAAKCMLLGHRGKATSELLKEFCEKDLIR